MNKIYLDNMIHLILMNKICLDNNEAYSSFSIMRETEVKYYKFCYPNITSIVRCVFTPLQSDYSGRHLKLIKISYCLGNQKATM